MGIRRAVTRAVKAAAKGENKEKILGEAAGGMVPRILGNRVADKVSDRVERGLRDVQDGGRTDTFRNHSEPDPWGDGLPTPPPPSRSSTTTSDSWDDLPPPPPPPSKKKYEVDPW